MFYIEAELEKALKGLLVELGEFYKHMITQLVREKDDETVKEAPPQKKCLTRSLLQSVL